MHIQFIQYPKCTTCQKAKRWLADHNISFDDRHIAEQNPTREELQSWHALSGLPLKKFFNTSGQLYRRMELKDKLASMTEDGMLELLASDGMLVKRPLVIGDDFVLVGFRESEWAERLGLDSVGAAVK